VPVLDSASEHQVVGAGRPGIWIPVGSGGDMTICAKVEPECQPPVSRNSTKYALALVLWLHQKHIMFLQRHMGLLLR